MSRLDWRLGTRTLLIMGAAAIALKALLLFVVLPYLQSASPTTYQAEKFPDWYDMLARNLVEGHGYRFFPETTRTMLRTPGWPLVLAGIFSVFGYGITAVKIFNFLCSIGTACLTFMVGERISRNRLLALLAALVAFLHPAMVVADSRGGVESVFIFLLMAFTALIYRALEVDSNRAYVLAGLTLGAALLVKSTAVLFAPCVFLYQVLSRPTVAIVKHAVVTTGALTLTAVLILSPWIVRNYTLSGKFVPTMTSGNMSAYCGFYIATHRYTGREQYVLDLEASDQMAVLATNMGLKFKPGYYPQFYSVDDEFRFYHHLGEVVRQEYREHPTTFVRVLADNAVGFWVRGRTQKATILNSILVLPFLGIAIFGAYAGLKRRLQILPIILFIGAFYAAHMTIQGQARYHLPLIPLLAILFSIAFLGLVSPAPVNSRRNNG